MIAMAADQGWSFRSIDISASFLQGCKIDRIVYICPPPEYNKLRVVGKLKKGLYGLKEAARLRCNELSNDLEKHGGQKLTGDPGYLVFYMEGVLQGFILIHMNDIIISGENKFQTHLVDQIKAMFHVSKDQVIRFVYHDNAGCS